MQAHTAAALLHRRDYQAHDVLDQYDEGMLDERQQRGLTADQRLRAEREMQARDAARSGRRLPGIDEVADEEGKCYTGVLVGAL